MADDRIPVILDLRLDADEYKGEITRLGRDIQELQTAITKVANIDTSKLTSSMKTSTERYIAAARNYGKALKEYQDTQYRSASAEKETKATAQLLESERKLRNAQREFLSMSDSDQLSKDYAEKLKQAQKLRAELDKLNQKSKEMSQVGATEKQWETINVQAQALKEKIYAITNELRKGADAGELFADDDLNKNNELIKLAIQNIKTYRKEVQGIASSIKVKKDTNTPEYTEAYQKQLKEVEKLEAALDKAKEKYNKLLATGGDTPKALAGMRYDLERVQEKAQDAGAKLSEMVNSGEAFKIGRGNAAAELDRIDEATTRITNDARELSKETERSAKGYGSVKDALAKVVAVGQRINSVVGAGFKSVQKVISGLGKGIKTVTTGIKSAISGVKKLISNFGLLGKQGGKTTDGLGKGFKKLQRHILMFGFGFRTAYFAIKRLRRIFVDAFKTMAAQYPKLNAQLNSFTMALNRLKGSLGTMFQPIISVAIPVIVRLMEYLSKAMEVAANFFAVLTGQRVIYRAVSNQEDYAASLNDTAKAEEDARRAHEKTVASYDKLDIINKDKNTGSDSPGNINTPNLPLNVTYEEVPVEGAISDFAERIKRAWAAADFTEIGEIVTRKVLDILERFRQVIVPKITGFINKLANVIITFVNGADFGAIGRKVGEIINDIVDQLDATRIGEALASIYNIFWRYINGIVNTIQWDLVGKKVAQFINGLIKQFDTNAVVGAITGFVMGITTALESFVNEFDWEGLASKISEFVTGLFDGIDVERVVQSITALFSAVTGTILKLVRGIDFAQAGQDLATGANSLLSSDTTASFIQNVGQLIGEFVSGCVEFLINFITTFDWTGVTDAIWLAISTILTTISENFMNSGNPLLETIGLLLSGILTVLESLFNIINNIILLIQGDIDFETFLNNLSTTEIIILAIVAAVGALSASIAVANGVMAIAGGIIAVLTSPITLVIAAIAALIAIILLCVKHWDEIKAAAVSVWEGIKGVWNAVSTWFDENIIQPVAKFFSNLWNDLKQGASDAWEGIKDVFKSVGEFFSNTFKDAWEGIVSVFSVAGEIFVNIKDGVVSAFKWIVNQIIRGINSVVSVPFNAINWALQKLHDVNILGVKPFGWINTINVPQIPELAKGAVIPPNKEFLAVLGDQKSGTNIEAPLDTIKQAVREVLGSGGGAASREPIVLQLNGRDVAKLVWDENQKLYKQTGKFQSIYNM